MAGIKVPGPDTYISSQSVPGNAPFEQASPEQFSLPERTAAHGFQQIEATGLLAQRHVQYVEAEEARQRQRDAVQLGVADAVEKLNQRETDLQQDPQTTSENFYSKWKDVANEVRQDALSNVKDPNATQALDTAITTHFRLRGTQAWNYGKHLFVEEQSAEADAGANQAIRLYEAAKDPTEGEAALENYRQWLSGKTPVFNPLGTAQRMQKFNDKVMVSQANILSKTSEGRAQLIEMDNAGKFDDVDPQKRSLIMGRVLAAEERAEKSSREAELAVKAQHNLWETEISGLVAQHKLGEASQKLEFLAGLNVLPAKDVDAYRKMIAAPPLDKISDPATKARVFLDVNSLKPQISEAQIKSYQADGSLSIQDATTALEKRTMVTRHLADQSRSINMQRQAQAEQNLQSMLHINPGTLNMMTNIDGDPRTRVYGQLLPQLVDRSVAFNGNEDPIAVVESFRPYIRDAFKSVDGFGLAPQEVDALYPDAQTLNKAFKTNRIDKDAYDAAVRRQQQQKAPQVDLPKLAPEAKPTGTQRKSRTYGNP